VFRALRPIPGVLDIARGVEAVAPRAQILNYTNPMAMLCLAVERASTMPIVGLCHSVQHTAHKLARYMGIPEDDLGYLVAGINHMAWYLDLVYEGRDMYPRLWEVLDDPAIYARDRVRFEAMRRFGYFVTESSEHFSEYVPYFIPHEGHIERIHIPIDDYIRRSQDNLNEFEKIRGKVEAGEDIEVEESVDPVCGMTVEVASARHTSEHDGITYYFCCPGCKKAFEKDPATFVGAAAQS